MREIEKRFNSDDGTLVAELNRRVRIAQVTARLTDTLKAKRELQALYDLRLYVTQQRSDPDKRGKPSAPQAGERQC
jgi:hypothetical protein